MSRMKQWTMSMSSWVDGMLAQVENHEASVSAAIGRVRQATARSRVQLKRVERDQQTLRDTLLTEEQAVEAWRRRAKSSQDEDAALECLRRHKAAQQRVRRLQERLAEIEQMGHIGGRVAKVVCG